MIGPQDPAAAGGDRLRAGHADRERVIETLKDAFVQGRLTRDDLDARAGRTLAARTCADLAALTADIPAAAGTARPPAPARRRPLAKAAARSGICLVIAGAAVRLAFLVDPDGPGPNPYHSWARWCLLIAFPPQWWHWASWSTGWRPRGSRDAPACNCRPPRGQASPPSRPDSAAAPAMRGFPRPPHRPDPRRPAGSQVTAAHSRAGGAGTPWCVAGARHG